VHPVHTASCTAQAGIMCCAARHMQLLLSQSQNMTCQHLALRVTCCTSTICSLQMIKFGGATFTDRSGLMSSTPQQEKVAAQPCTAAGTSYTVQVPRASAALLVAQGKA
jgi:hypothetical protein